MATPSIIIDCQDCSGWGREICPACDDENGGEGCDRCDGFGAIPCHVCRGYEIHPMDASWLDGMFGGIVYRSRAEAWRMCDWEANL